jgi:hypothetical protein
LTNGEHYTCLGWLIFSRLEFPQEFKKDLLGEVFPIGFKPTPIAAKPLDTASHNLSSIE